ncbi:cytochrome ubiquinol oxidase subunit I, partial [Bacillus thuringiensis]|nr:cytochrome ubiquinol oxidase subunit I [Bacillus thuringiensis]
VMGIIPGISMEFQFGTNWSEYSKYRGDIFGTPLAKQAPLAYLLESILMRILLLGKATISPKFRDFIMWMVDLGTKISAL